MTDVKAQSEDHAPDQPHPSTFSPATFALLIVLAIFGAIIGIQLILQLGATPNTSIIGALVAMILARVPLKLFARYRSVHVQNLAQSNISAATFGAAKPPCTNWCPVSSWPRRPDIADAGRRGTGDAAGCVLALSDVRHQGLSRVGQMATGSNGSGSHQGRRSGRSAGAAARCRTRDRHGREAGQKSECRP